jgi:hypothetical protein
VLVINKVVGDIKKTQMLELRAVELMSVDACLNRRGELGRLLNLFIV